MIFYRSRFHLGVHDRLCNSQTNMLNNTPTRGRFKNSLSSNSHLGFQAWIILCYPEIYLKIPECRHIYDNHHGFIAGNLNMTRYPRSNTQDTLLGIKSGTYLTTPGRGWGPRPQKALFYLRTPSKGPKKGLFGALQIRGGKATILFWPFGLGQGVMVNGQKFWPWPWPKFQL